MPCPFIAKEKHNISILNLNNLNLILNTVNMKKKHFKAVGELFKPLLKGLLSAVVLGVTLSTAMAQEREVTGSILDENGEGLPGVTIIIKGTTSGTISDFNGIYKLNLSEEGSALVFSALGYDTQEITVGSRSVIDISMTTNVSELEEIVVTGYLSQSKKSVSGAISSVDMGEATKVPLFNAAEALQGRATGVTVTSGGAPGSVPTIRIRGYGTPNNNDPLYVIDGVQTTDAYVLNSINPSDIEQMNVLKDGAAAIYGARASNGVVVITTKNGKYNSGKAKLTFSSYFGTQKASNLPELLTAEQHKDMVFDSRTNDNYDFTLGHPQYDPTGSGTYSVPSSINGTPAGTTANVNGKTGTNWMDEIFRDAPLQNYALTLESGSNSSKMLMSANYMNRDGIQLGGGYDRVNTRLNTEFSVKDRVRIGEHLSASFENANGGNSMEAALRMNPLIPVRDTDGNFSGIYSTSNAMGNQSNPVGNLLNAKNDYNKTLRVVGDIYAEVDILNDLTFKTSAGINYRTYEQRVFLPQTPANETKNEEADLLHQNQTSYEWVWSNTLNYDKTFGQHRINVLAGTEAVYNSYRGQQVQRSGYLFEDPNFYFLSNGSGAPVINYANASSYSLYSVFGSVNYSFSGKYFASITVRNDKTSRFSQANAAATFPAFSAGWLVSDEAFFPKGFVSTMKLRASYGTMGNQSLTAANPDVNQSALDETTAYYSFDGSSLASVGAKLSQVGNANLKWETSVSQNFGIDLAFMNDRLYLNADLFSITTNDLISQDNTLIGTTAIDASAPYVNVGEFKNSGIELALGYAGATTSGFSYGVDVIFSSYKNEVISLITDYYTGGGFRNGDATRTGYGADRVLSEFYGRQVIGIFASEAEVAAAPDQGFATNADGVGRFQYANLNEDNVINDDDRTFIGSPHPDFTYGINLTAGFKGFDLSAFFQGTQGNEIYNTLAIYTDFPTFFSLNRSTRVLDSWSSTNTGAELPALSENVTNSETNPNSYFVEDGSYFRLKNLQLGYNIPSSALSKLGMSAARIYVQGTNLFTSTKYNGADPEIQESGSLTLGVDYGKYPLAKVVTVGLKFNF
jgi:TonB-linked SusC/RagA family outer membrane protein